MKIFASLELHYALEIRKTVCTFFQPQATLQADGLKVLKCGLAFLLKVKIH